MRTSVSEILNIKMEENNPEGRLKSYGKTKDQSWLMRIPGAAGLLNPALQKDHGLSLRGLCVFAKLSQVLVEV